VKYFIPNVGGVGDSIMRSSIALDIVDSFSDVELYSTNKLLYSGTGVNIVNAKHEAISLGATVLPMRYYDLIRSGDNGDLYSLIRYKASKAMGRDIPKIREHAVISNFKKEKPPYLPEKYWVVMPQSKKRDKSWGKTNYQHVIDNSNFAFVSVGGRANEQSELDGVIDLRGKTTLKELFSIIYHSDGVLCSVGLGAHLGCCVEGDRPVICIFGGRESAHRFPYKNLISFESNHKNRSCPHFDCYSISRRCILGGDETPKRCFNDIRPEDVLMELSRYE
jgi:ADP-heptose:LPS heptosyltransferase